MLNENHLPGVAATLIAAVGLGTGLAVGGPRFATTAPLTTYQPDMFFVLIGCSLIIIITLTILHQTHA